MSLIALDGFKFQSKTIALVNAMTVKPTAQWKKKINTFFKNTADIPLVFLQVYKGETEQATKLNWIQPSLYTATYGGNYVFTVNQGITGDQATAYIDTGFSPNSNGGIYTQNSGSHGVWVNTELTENNIVCGLTSASTSTDIFPRYTGNVAYMYANTSSGAGISNSSSIGYFAVDRNNAANEQYYVRGALLGTQVGASAAIPTGNDHVLCRWNAALSNRSLFSGHQVAARWYAGTMSAGQHSQLANELNTLLAS